MEQSFIEKHFFEWVILVLILIGLFYTMIVIKEEKKSYLESAIKKVFHNYVFLIPSWWGLALEEENHLVYKRLDTHYDWEAVFKRFKDIPSNSIDEQMVEELKKMKLVFDEDTTIIKKNKDIHESYDHFEVVRVEGTATRDLVDRLYLDAFLVRNSKEDEYLWITSTSSVLNGVIEGPYFEEMMFNFSWEKSDVVS
jgi:hypothetical protein